MIDYNKFKDVKILVVGDIMLDEYIIGEAHRMSPEAPVPVILNPESKFGLGGAGNVLANVASLGAQVEIFGVIGKDLYGGVVKNQILQCGGNSFKGLVEVNGRQTTRKRRIIANGQQVARIDFEDTEPIYTEVGRWLLDAIELANLVIISDYAKGFITEELMKLIRSLCQRANIPRIIDPKGNDYSKYAGAYTVTPNEKEISNLFFPGIINSFNVLLTQGSKGMSLYEKIKGPEPLHIPAEAKAVSDVSGAGDTVIAALGVAIASGYGLEKSARFANRCAGIVVGKPGTAVVTVEDLEKNQ